MMFAILGLFFLFGAVFIAAGEYDWLASGFVWWGVAWFVTYVVSIYALATLSGKSRRRRLASWGFSTAFHAAMILYFALALDWGTAAVIFLAPAIVAGATTISAIDFASDARKATRDPSREKLKLDPTDASAGRPAGHVQLRSQEPGPLLRRQRLLHRQRGAGRRVRSAEDGEPLRHPGVHR